MRTLITAPGIVSLLALVACSNEPAAEKAAAETPPVAAAAGMHINQAPLGEMPIDPVTGFKVSGDWQLVRAHCTGCHSAKLITQQRGTAQQWLSMIRWMQKKQNLWQFDADTERRIIAYLSEHYPPDEARRRAAIPSELMPPNPYASAAINE